MATACLAAAVALFLLGAEGKAVRGEDRPTALSLRCHVAFAGYRIVAPDGRDMLNGDSGPMPPSDDALVSIDRATGTVRITGGSLPHFPDAAPGRADLSGSTVRFVWGEVAYSIEAAEPPGQDTLRFKSRTVLRGAPYDGSTMESFGVGACTPSIPR